MDYEQRSKAWVDEHFRRVKARGGVGWADVSYKNREAARRLAALVREHGSPGGRMLEIGCGAGDISLLVAPEGLFDEIHGVDISEDAIAWAREKAERSGRAICFHVGNMVDLREFASASFDAVVAFACLHWIIGDDDRRECLASVSRVLKPGGRFYVHTSCRSAEVIEGYQGGDGFDPARNLIIRNGLPYFHLKPLAEVLEEIGAAGLDVAYWELGEREEDDSAYFSGPLLVVAAKPG
jgi:cyclopropane fatty-acyl-phospholipid synthase-like methyltransferase